MATQSSSQILQQIQTLGEMPNYRQEIAKAYDAPVLRPLVQEGANLEAQYLPALFEPFTQMGTGAADMSPAAKLAALGGSVGRLSSRIGANQGIQNFYGTQINDLANQMSNSWKDRLQNMWAMYNAQNQREEQDRQARAQAAQMAAMYGQGGGAGAGMGGEQMFDVTATGRNTDATSNVGRGLAGLYGSAATALQKVNPTYFRQMDSVLNQSPFLKDLGMRLGDVANWGLGTRVAQGYQTPGLRTAATKVRR